MVKLLMGLKGSGKTKKLVDMVCEAIENDKGDVVVIEKERKLTYDIPYKARLVDAGAYGIDNYSLLKGMLCGMHAGNYDITNVFVDNFFKLVGDKSSDSLVAFVKWLEMFSENEKVDFVLSISADPSEMSDELKPYCI
jgi:hypothetical protein